VQDPSIRAMTPVIFALTLGTTTLLLLLACVNVTTLLLSRSVARQREIAVRLSLGAGRFRLLRQLLTESMVLSGLASLFSILIAHRGPAALWASLMSFPAPFDLSPDWRVFLYCLVVALLAGAVAGLSPALESLRFQISETLKGSSAAATTGRRRSRLRGVLVGTQIALSLILLVEAGLFARAQRRFFHYDPGFETRQVLSLTLVSVLSGFEPSPSFYQELQSRVDGMPDVVQKSFTEPPPWSGRNSSQLLEIDGKPVPDSPHPPRRFVSPEYFTVLGIGLTRGRIFARDELLQQRQVIPVVISEAMARQYWYGQDPIGHRFRTNYLHEVIGVCRDVQSVTYLQDDGSLYYVPLDLQQRKSANMLVRVFGDTQAATAAVREIVRQIDPQMATAVITLVSVVEQNGERLRPIMIHGAVAGTLALLLALSGVYAVVSFSVSQRIREIGIRMALGAQKHDIVSLLMRSGVAPVLGGLIAGICLALAVTAVMKAILFGMNPRDPLTFAAASLLLLIAALAAIWIPARRAAKLDPLSSLRHD
jgi:putative ABC transport system permease protein